MVAVHERIFGSLAAREAIIGQRSERLARKGVDPATPVTYLQGNPLWGQGLSGVNVMAIRPGGPQDVWLVRDESGRALGRGWNRQGATFLLLQNINGKDQRIDEDRNIQAGRMFDRADELLRTQNTDYRSVARTWLYLNRILSWYGEFNKVRNVKYGEFGLMPALGPAGEPGGSNGNAILLPASTGIEGSTPAGAAVTMDCLSARLSPGSAIEIHQMTNSKQQDAFKYGSAFSRAAAIRMPHATWISLSGTAAIDEAGITMHVGDFKAQMNATLDAVEALIAQEGAGLGDLCDLTCFVKLPEHIEAYHEILAHRGLKDLAGVSVLADVCRDDLLFEVDGAAVVRRP
jgi:enamine deaminase RidA (YjgF/YER057c/UK114 family)